MTKPVFVSEDHLKFLDDLRNSGETNMFGAAPFIIDRFGCTKDEARQILSYWMQSFGNPNR
jgi:hypothetical protein